MTQLPVLRSAMCCVAVMAIASAPVFAGKASEIASELAQPGKVVIDDAFARDAPGDAWTVGKGSWTIADGALVGREVKTDMHAAVVAVGGKHRDTIARFSFQLAGAKHLHLSLNKQGGHLFRVVIDETGLSLTKDKDKKDAASKPLNLGRAAGTFEPNEWHTIQVEIVGDKVVVKADNGLKVSGQHADLNVDKLGYRFVVSGESVRIDDLKVWEAKK